MQGYIIFLLVAFVLLTLGDITRKKGFLNLTIRREVEKKAIVEGEETKVTTIIENNKWLPISFLHVQEIFPINMPRISEDAVYSDMDKFLFYSNRYNVLWFERIKRTYKVKGLKRGTYLLKNIRLSIGDVFGFSYEGKDLEDFVEIVVYPKLIDTKNFNFESTNIQGDNIVKRWIFKDPLYIKGIREYNIEDRMKDIHWQSSLKLGKLMVRDYDFTSEKEIIFIINSQCGEPYWATIDGKIIDNAVNLGVSLAARAQKEGLAAGMWSNAHIISYEGEVKGEVEPSINNMKGILELGARIDYSTRMDFYKYLDEKLKDFNQSATYVIITSFLDDISMNTLSKLRRAGTILKVIDISHKGDVPSIDGIDKILYKGERK